MQRLKFLLMLLASVTLLACVGGEEPVGGSNNNDGGGAPPDKPNPETPVSTEKLPEGVEIGEGTLQLNNIQLEHIETIDEDNSTLTFSAELPAEHIPQQGQILLQYSATEDLPYGFLGRVTNVTTVGNNIIVETEAPALDEAFDKLVIDYDMNNIQTKSRVDVEDNVSIDENNYMRFTRVLTMEDIDLECELSLGVNISSNIHIDGSNNIDNQQYGFGMMAEATINYAPSIEEEYSNIHDFGDGIRVRLPYASPAILGAIQFSWISEAKGSIKNEHTITAKVNRVFYVNKNGMQTQTSNDNIGEASMDVDYKSNLQLEGELFSALGIRLDLRLFGRKELSVGLGTEVGPRASAEIKLSTEDENLYEAFKDECITLQGMLKTKAYAQAKLFNFDADWSKEFGEGWAFWEASRYVFPEFKTSTLEIANGKAECSTTVGRDLLFKSEVGIGQYDANEELVESSEPEPYFLEKDFEKNPLEASFTHKKDHTYWSFIKWGENIIKCKTLGNSIVGTWKCIHDSDYDFEWDIHEGEDSWGWTYTADGIAYDFDFYEGIYDFDSDNITTYRIEGDKIIHTYSDGYTYRYTIKSLKDDIMIVHFSSRTDVIFKRLPKMILP